MVFSSLAFIFGFLPVLLAVYYFVDDRYKNVVLLLSDIIYLEAMDNYVRLHLTNGQKLVTQTTLSSLAAQLPESLFVRVHKSFIISRRQIESYSRQQVFLHGEPHPIPIGRTYSAVFSKP